MTQSSIAAFSGLELVDPVRKPDERGVFCPDCHQDVSQTKGSHEASEEIPAEKVWGWFCESCNNILPSRTHGSDAPTFNDRITAVRGQPRGSESERWIPVPASSVSGGDQRGD